ncbi:sigma-54-dependent Fis family transcriptional regulator [Niallia endozanthoxylica]|uniref:Sigma-54-dependent Fis family transcriptional regulator n=1 Tax=Niallia endozanthoxylica TaxID=2036016 RepID=A0A5J5I0K5_9BACI|nr:sigma-54-dependent Fis family transcriptional regulator [Niallia endozanthoxylica]KAA9027029.1 sigma-54-dependent Fis family transcriptional regulator [Niallia endozanthoxylica]
MDNPFLSIFSTKDLSNKVSEIKHKWETFITNPTNGENLENIVRRDILHSWSRCHSIGINPEQKQARTALTSFELETLLSESELYHTAKPIIDNIYDKLIGTGYLITLNDESGKMLYLKGEKELIRKTERINFLPGMDWSENAAGTNAIGTSIVSKKPIQVFSAEHFCEGFHPMTCSASPIFHPYTKNAIGAIDFTGFWPSTQPHTLGLAVSLAQMIEQQLQLKYRSKYTKLEEYYHQYTFKYREHSVLVISNDAVLVNGDRTLLNVLQLKKESTFENHLKIKKLLQNPASFFNQAKEYQFIHLEPIIINYEEVGYAAILNKKAKASSSMLALAQAKDHQLIGESVEMKEILHKCRQIALVTTPVLLTGETGTGKELIARYIHDVSSRSDKPFIAINCGAMQKELIGSELFGYESGTFTGGKKEGKKGKFEEANGGTIFLDEIGEMPLDLQVHLLRVLQEKELTRLGSSKTITIDVKVIAATHRNLEAMIEEGLFRRDLFFRLNVISFSVPSLSERTEDIIPISHHYLRLFAEKYNKTLSLRLAEKTESFFLSYKWPGNIRELRNALEHAVIFSDSAEIDVRHLPDYLAHVQPQPALDKVEHDSFSVMEKTEMEQIRKLLIHSKWNISAVAKELRMARSTLYRKLKKYQLRDLNNTFQ